MRKQSVLETEAELRSKLDELYILSNEGTINGFEGLLEIAKSEPTIITAIHKLKSNKGAETKGTDDNTIRTHLEKPLAQVIVEVQSAMSHYKPKPVRRKYIPKKNGKMRPLGIPSAIDKIVQQCIRIVIEPILDAKMYEHSYGFRTMRNQENAIGRICAVMNLTGYQWVVEGDIKGFFDNVNHKILLQRLYAMGIHDKRILAIIREMLKAGIMGECQRNEIGTPQGGIISPLLSNVYLNSFDWFVAKAWERKKTRYEYNRDGDRKAALRENSNLKPAYLVRFADDWVIITNSRENALVWKENARIYLHDKLKLELSDEKTVITQATRKPISFLGINIKLQPNPKAKGRRASMKTISWPKREAIRAKMQEAKELVKELHKTKYIGSSIDIINRANAIVRGLANYYSITSRVNIELGKYSYDYLRTAFKAAKSSKRLRVEWIPANQVLNNTAVHSRYTTKIPAIKIGEGWLGITSPKFVVFKKPNLKNQNETPYTEEGRKLYEKRRGKKSLKLRADEMLSDSYARYIAEGKTKDIYNFEFYMNRAYAFNRDKGRCKCCGKELQAYEVEAHHKNPRLPLSEVNRVKHLETTCKECHSLIHAKTDLSKVEKKRAQKIAKLRDMLK